MSNWASFEPLALEGMELKVEPAGMVRLSGTITMRSPSQVLQPHLRKLHDAALAAALDTVTVDVRKLTFVNSSSMRLFVDWTVWLKDQPPEKRYKLVFLTDGAVTWQRKSFPVIRSLAPDIVEIKTEQA